MKKKIVEVDEDVLEGNHCRRHTCFSKDSLSPRKPVEHQEAKAPPQPYRQILQRKSLRGEAQRKRIDPADTGKVLVNIPPSNRSHVYINREVAECIKRVLPVIARR